MPLFLLSAFGWLKQALGALLGVIGRYPLQCALIAALALSWWQWSGKQDALADRDAARRDVATERASHAVTRSSVATLKASLAIQNAEIRAYEREGVNSRAKVANALREAQRANTRADDALAKVRGRTVKDCETGEAIFRAGL